MKKIIITVMFFAFAANVSAQVKVNSTGQVGIGTANPKYKLDVAGDTHITGNARVVGGIYVGNNILNITNSRSITFKLGGVLVGYTGGADAGEKGTDNVSFGYNALSNTIGAQNTAIGYKVLSFNTTGDSNTAIGALALLSNTTGIQNTAIGYRVLSSNTIGNYNTANGAWALQANTTGIYNTANSAYALYNNTTGNYNTANGAIALFSNTTGQYNTSSGYFALYANATGSHNTAIGYSANVNASDLSNTIAIGYIASPTASNQVRIGNSSITSIGGYASWTNLSDKRVKKNIRTDVPGLAFINLLQPVTYNLDLDAIDGLLKIDRTKRPGGEELPQELIDIDKKAREAKEKQIQTGFIAQEVEAIAKSIGYDFSGVDVDETGIYGLRYAEFVVPLVKAVQELSTQVNELTALVNRLQGKDVAPALLKSENVAESATGLQDLTSSGASLQQNTPNPFNQTTIIRYTLPQTGKLAQIVISNTAGKIVRQIPLSGGIDSITIEGGALSAGIYYYSLYVDNKLVDTKQLILTK
jgi:hypothetical protein